MKKSVLMIVVALVAIGAIIGVVVANNKSDEPKSNTTTEQTENKATEQNEYSNSNTQQPASQTNSVTIKDFSFQPKKITVKKGTKVTWTNQDTVKHTVTPDDESVDFKSSELLGKGESYSVTFNAVGTFNYHCQPHPNMTASVEVTE